MVLPHFSALGSGPMVLMLHGAAGGYRSFAPQVEHYAWAGYRAVAWDMPGYGLSAPVEPYGVRGLAQSCERLIEALLPQEASGPERSVALIGHGLGGMVAQELVMRRPDLVSRLVLSASTSGPDSGWADDAHAQLAQLDAHQGSMQGLAGEVLPQQTGPLALAEGVRLAQHCMAQVSPVTYRLALQAQAGIGAGNVTVFDNTNAHIGVGNSSTAAAAAQTDLQGASKHYEPMDATYPVHTDGTGSGAASIVFRSTFETADANFPELADRLGITL